MVAQTNSSVIRAFQILQLFLDGRPEVSAPAVTAALGMNGITAHRFLKTLETTGALVPVGRGTYRLGFALADLGARAASSDSLVSVIQPVLDHLAASTREGAMAATFDGDMVICRARATPDRPLYVDIRPGSQLDAWCTAHGKLWLAALSEPALATYIAQHVPEDRREFLQQELQSVRARGLSFNRQEREPEINAVAVPVTARDGRMICSLSIFGPAGRLTQDEMDRFTPALRAAATQISDNLYGAAP